VPRAAAEGGYEEGVELVELAAGSFFGLVPVVLGLVLEDPLPALLSEPPALPPDSDEDDEDDVDEAAGRRLSFL
jgi:hypothetical protein